MSGAHEEDVELYLSREEADSLLVIAEACNQSIEDLVHELIADCLSCGKKRSTSTSKTDSLAGQWPEDSDDPESVFHDAMWPDDWRTDHLGTILRGVAYCDALLLKILQCQFANPTIRNIRNIRNPGKNTFMQKANLVHAIGLIDVEMLGSLRILADIRNAFAHEIDRRFTHNDVQKLCDSLTGRAWDLFVCYAGASSKSPQRIRHALTIMKIALEEIAYPDRPRDYAWFDAAVAAGRRNPADKANCVL